MANKYYPSTKGSLKFASLFGGGWAAILLAITLLGQLHKDRFPDWYSLTMAPAVGLGIGAVLGLCFYLCGRFFYTEVRKDSLYGPNYFGLYREVKWDDVSEVTVESMYGYHYLIVFSSHRGLPLMIPLKLDKPAEFQSLIGLYAGLDHPIALALADLKQEGLF